MDFLATASATDRRGSAALALLLCCSGWAFLANAQPALVRAKTGKRPIIGLVLSGGGAVGLAHIGVIRWLEEHRIPVDRIAGTSMGGLAGGLYAAGYDAREMARFFEQIDWPNVLRMNPRFEDLSFRRKEDRRQFPIALEVGLADGRLHLPMGLSPGHGAGLVISRAAAPYAELRSFDDLPIPFRCVAADLVQGREVVFSDGPLFDALRATMSIPGVFAPVRSGVRILVDGGILNNLPVDVMRAMGADVIIAVGLDSPESDQTYGNMIGVVRRSLGMMTSANERRNMKSLSDADIILMPDLEGFTSQSYDQGKLLADRGYREAGRKRRFLETLAVDEADWAAIIAERKRRRKPEWNQPEFVEVTGIPEGGKRISPLGLVGVPAGTLDRPALEGALDRITGLGRYKAADYGFTAKHGVPGIAVGVHEKMYGPPFLNMGISLFGSNAEGLNLAVAGRLTFLDYPAPNSEWRTDFSLGIDNLLATEYYQRFGNSRFFAASGLFLSERSQGFANSGGAPPQYDIREAGGHLHFGYAAGRYSELRFGYRMSTLRTEVAGGSAAPRLSGTVSAAQLAFTHDRMDKILPESGRYFSARTDWVNRWPGAHQRFAILESRIAHAKKLGDSTVLLAATSGGTAFTGGAGHPPFTLGGPTRLASLARNQLAGNYYYFNGLYMMRQLSRNGHPWIGGFRAMLGHEAGNAFSSGDRPGPFHNGVAGLIRESPAGVIFAGCSLGERGEKKIYVTVGRFFY